MYGSDKRLARRILGGDERAFDEFFDAYFPGLYRFALVRVVGDHDSAEEMAQSTLFKAMSKLGTYRGEASLFTWLCTFCRHEISALHRRRERSPRLADLLEDAPEIRAALESQGAEGEESPDATLLRKEIARLVQVVLDSLHGRYGDALEWKYLEDAPVVEIASRLGLSVKAAESLLTRARAAFRESFTSMAGALPGLRPVNGDPVQS